VNFWGWFLYGSLLNERASPAELLWTLLAVAGLVLNMLAVVDAQRDLALLRARLANGARELVARNHRRNALVRGGVKLGFGVVGLLYMGTLPPVRRTTAFPGLVVLFLVVIAGLTWSDIVDRADRRKLLRLMASQPVNPEE
jgi:asparagine N-glycosylation enzyme membrane subunit Stt3